ncbi:hypothetical protein [Glycomyces harbinensis]|uniref:HEAT repeat-containing protein n=1 Tax=Glycomyces harbinensis TaxID=58114 RepID=A0A1G6SGT3_9ACTN|nr:hypothetical protein [Glycomyces harbinensis]SDD16140.1 hypothetical protein SAMN05216270_10296 [Glycomyces harbinensis]
MRTATPPSAAELLAAADHRSFHDRTRALYRTARDCRDHDRFPVLLTDLARHGVFGSRLSLQLASFAGRTDHLRALLDHPDAETAAAALTAAVEHAGMAAAVEASIPAQSRTARLAAYRALRKHRDESLADRLLPAVARHDGPAEAARLLPACSDAVVAAHLDELAPHVLSWSPFAKHRLAVLTEYATAALAARSPEQYANWWRGHASGLTAALERAPLAWLDLLERHPSEATDQAVRAALPALLAADSERTWAYLLDPRRSLLLASAMRRRAVLRRLAAEPSSRIALLVGRGGADLPSVLGHVAPSRRTEVLDAVRQTGVAVDEAAVLADLPADARTETARRLLADRRVAGDPGSRERARSHLPYDEVRDDLTAGTRRSDVHERARSYLGLVRAAGLSGDGALTDLLGRLGRAAKDQDPVHDAILTGLLAVRPRDWTAANLAELETLAAGFLASPARSSGTASRLTTLAARLVRTARGRSEPTETGRRLLTRLLAESATWELAAAFRSLPHRFVADLAQQAAPDLAVRAAANEYTAAITLASVLGRRLGQVPALEPVLRRALDSKNTGARHDAAQCLLRIGNGAHARIAELAEAFPGRSEWFRPLAAHRCDLLPAWFATIREDAPTAVLREVAGHLSESILDQWPPAVRAAYRKTLHANATDTRRTPSMRLAAAHALARVPGLAMADLAPLLDGDDPAVRAAAVSDLHRVSPVEDAWAALPSLLASPDAAFAAAAMDRLAQRSRPGALAADVAPLLDSPKVTARKQAVRVLARFRVPGAGELLTGLWHEAALHESVREAVAASAVERLGEPWAQSVVEDVDRFGPDVRVAVLGLAPEQVPAGFRNRYVELLVAAAGHDDDRLQVAGANGLARWAGHAPEAADALVALATDLDATDLWAAAVNALCSIAAAGGEPGPLLRAADLLSEAPDEPNADEDRDLPVRQRFERILGGLAPLYQYLTVPPGVIAAVAERLPSDLGTRLLARTIAWDAGSEEIRALLGRLQDPLEARLIGEAIDERILYDTVPDALPFVTALVDSGDTHGAIVAASVIDSAASESEWDEPWRDLLRRLRAHESSSVRVLAFSVYTAEE